MITSFDGRKPVWTPLPRQQIALTCPAFEVLYGGQKGGGKALRLGTMIPTPTGWKRHGDLAPGDHVFAPDGAVATVVFNTGPMEGRKCWKLSFSDGTSIVCDEDHRWATRTHAERHLTRSGPSVRTTREIVDTLKWKGEYTNHSVEAIEPVPMPEASLAIPPYVLGAWLGDGTSANGNFTSHPRDAEVSASIRTDGFVVSDHPHNELSHTIVGLKPLLASLDLLGDKHIPASYLRASVSQRIALLQGLMDTDGWAEKDGTCFIALTNKRLFDGVVELLRSLGIVVRVSSPVKTCTTTGSKSQAYQARFVSSIPAFRLPRKLERQNLKPHERWTRRFIVAAEPVDSEPVNCIKVDRADGLYVAGEQWITTHNTDFLVASCIPILMRAHAKWRRTGLQQPRCRIVIFRRNLDDLTDIIARTKELYPVLDPEMGLAGWNSNFKTWTFSSGARVEMRHLDGPEDHKGYNGQELRAVLIDQVEEIPEETAMFLIAQIRTTDPEFRDLLMFRATANPGGRHGDWVYKRYIAPHPQGNEILWEEVKNRDGSVKRISRAFVPATLGDNPYLNEDGQYEARLRATLPEHMIKQYLEGDWNVVVGAYFASMIRSDVHSMDTTEFLRRFPRGIPASWDIKFGLDWGSSAPAAAVFCAMDSEDRIWVFDEFYTPGRTGRYFGEKLKKYVDSQQWSSEKRWNVGDYYGLVDTQAWADYGAEGAAPADSIASFGFRLFEANKDRDTGVEQIRERLIVRPDGLPGVVILRDRAPNLWRTIRTVRTDEKDPEKGYDKRDEAHAVDALRFVLQDWPVRPVVKQHPVDADVERWERMLRAAKTRQGPADAHAMTTGYD